MNRKGFTLTELLAVIAILAILSVGAISGYSTMTRNSRKKSYETKVSEIENAAVKYAKETSLTSATTISVNKLVVEGFLQPDESTDSGLASIKNPQNGENMICNIIEITINDDIYYAKYDKNKKNCLIAEQELADLEISVEARKLDGNSITGNLEMNGGVTSWTNTDVLLIVSSEKYTDFSSISYDFDGMTITKEKKGAPISTATEYNENDYDKIAIKDVVVMFNSEVTITYNMNDGSTHSRTIMVRIDKEAPTARATVSNDVSISSTKKVNLYLDDANGSGVKGFYVSQNDNFDNKTIIDRVNNSGSKADGTGSFAGYNSYFYGGDNDYYVKVVDNAGNTLVTDKIVVSNFDPTKNACKIYVKKLSTNEDWVPLDEKWYNEPIRVFTESTNDIGTMGIKYFYGIVNINGVVTAENKLNRKFIPDGSNKKMIDYIDQKEDSNLRDYHTSMKGFSTLNKEVSTCSKTIGVDQVNPTVSFDCKDCNKYEKTHNVTIILTDDRSGFYDSAKSIKIGFSTSNTTPPKDNEWVTISGGVKSKNGTIEDGKITINTSVNANNGGSPITGDYYIWVKKDSFEDKAHNNAAKDTPSNFVILYDNTPPTCTNEGGKKEWTASNLTITGKCSDAHSKCKKGTDSSNTNYDIVYADGGHVKKTYKTDTNVTNASPGRIYDNAGNYTDCLGNQEVHVDKTDPTCTTSGGSSSWTNGSVIIYGTCADSGSGCVQKTVAGYSYDENGKVSRTYSSQIDSKEESPGTVYDAVGHSTTCKNDREVHIDTTPPTCTNVQSGTTYLTGNSIKISGTCTDSGGSKCTNTTFSVEATSTGTYNPGPVYDKAGNSGACSNVSVIKDTTPPTCVTTGGNKSWTKNDVTITGTCTDNESDCVLKIITKKIYSGTHEKASPGKVCNNAGLCAQCPEVKVMVDQTKPSCTFSKGCAACPSPNNVTTYTAYCSDSGSGHSHSKSSWYIGTTVTPDYYNEPNGKNGANEWVEGLCSGNSNISFSARVCDLVGNCRTYSKTLS